VNRILDNWRGIWSSMLMGEAYQPERPVEAVDLWNFFSWPQYNIVVILYFVKMSE
jgi:hypothetical protein